MAENKNDIVNTMDSLMKNLDHLVGSKTVIGEPTTVGDATIIPLVDVSFGLAAGAGSRTNGSNKASAAGGINAKLAPSAILVIQNGHSRLISVKGTDAITRITDLVPELIDKFKARKNMNVDKDEAVESAFPEGTDAKTE